MPTFKEVIEHLGEDKDRVEFWKRSLRSAGLIDPQKDGKAFVYSEGELHQFVQLQQLYDGGKRTIKDSIKLMQHEAPQELILERNKELESQLRAKNLELEQAHNKIKELKTMPVEVTASSWWTKILRWFAWWKTE